MDNAIHSQFKHFPLIILIGRPASGKSEIINYLQQMDLEERIDRFHIAELDIMDDFPMLWTWFEEDQILEELGEARIHTDSDGYFKHEYQYYLLIKRLELEYHKRTRDDATYHEHTTAIIEFSRGSEHGGYAQALRQFTPNLLQLSSLVYVNVSFAESLRKNRLRFNPDRPYSNLEHAVPDRKLQRLYHQDDWEDVNRADSNYLQIDSFHVPYSIFENEDDVTTNTPDLLGTRLEISLKHLWNNFISR